MEAGKGGADCQTTETRLSDRCVDDTLLAEAI